MWLPGVAVAESCHCLGSACRPIRSHPPGKGGGAWARGRGSPPGLAAQRTASLPPGSPVACGGAPLPVAGLLWARRGQRGSRGATVLAGPLWREPFPAERAASGVWKVRRAAAQWSRGESGTCPPSRPPSRAKGGNALLSGACLDGDLARPRSAALTQPAKARPSGGGDRPPTGGALSMQTAGGWGVGGG